MAIKVPYPYPDLSKEPPEWDPYAILRNFDFLAQSISSTQETSGTLIAFSTGEATCTNAATDLHTFPSLVISVDDGVFLRGNYRKTSGAANTASLGLKVNGVQIIANAAVTSSTNQAETGTFEVNIWQQSTNYLKSAFLRANDGTTGTTFTIHPLANNLPNATITSITITGVTASASITLGVQDVTLSRIPGVI
jgi:hypothetical protein